MVRVGFSPFLPFALALAAKVVCASRCIHRLELVELVEKDGRTTLEYSRGGNHGGWTHIKRVYANMDVRDKQELMSMIEANLSERAR